jgi:hypothetical protein
MSYSVLRKSFVVLSVVLLMGCATTQVVQTQKFTLTQRVIETEPLGKVIIIKDTYEPVVPSNFWSTVIDMAVSVGKKAGGL